MTFSTVFTPAVNKDGFSLLTYRGIETKSGAAGEANTKTGEVYQQDWKIVQLVFEVKGTRNDVQTFKQKVSERYSETNALGVILKGMGFIPPTAEMVEDEDGLLVLATETDEDGMEIETTEIDIATAITEFLNVCEGKKFLAKLERETEGKQKGFLKMKIETIKQHVKPVK